MGFILCAHFSYDYLNRYDDSGFRARVKAIGGMPHNQYVSQLFFRKGTEECEDHVWLLYLSRDDWFRTVGNGECSQIEVVFENDSGSRSTMNPVMRCGVSLVYEQDMGLMEKFFAFTQSILKNFNQRLIIVRDGWTYSRVNR